VDVERLEAGGTGEGDVELGDSLQINSPAVLPGREHSCAVRALCSPRDWMRRPARRKSFSPGFVIDLVARQSIAQRRIAGVSASGLTTSLSSAR